MLWRENCFLEFDLSQTILITTITFCNQLYVLFLGGVEIQETNSEYNLDIGDSCGFPGSPRNGSVGSAVMLYRPGEKVTFSCQEGFVLFGPDKRTCRRNGTWSDTIPECRKQINMIFENSIKTRREKVRKIKICVYIIYHF